MSSTPAPVPVTRPGAAQRRLVARRWLFRLALTTLLIGTWYLAAYVVRRSGGPLAVAKAPYPHEVASQFATSSHDLLESTSVTLTRALEGFATGGALAFLIAALMIESRSIEAAFMPYLIALQTIPLIALVPLLRAITKNDDITRILIAAFVTFFVVALSVIRGLKASDPEAISLMRSYGAGRLRTLRHVQIPTCLPFLFSALRIAAPLSLVGAVLTDLLGSNSGLGFIMISAITFGQFKLLWTAVIIIVALGAAMAACVGLAERFAAPWQHQFRQDLEQERQ